MFGLNQQIACVLCNFLTKKFYSCWKKLNLKKKIMPFYAIFWILIVWKCEPVIGKCSFWLLCSIAITLVHCRKVCDALQNNLEHPQKFNITLVSCFHRGRISIRNKYRQMFLVWKFENIPRKKYLWCCRLLFKSCRLSSGN